MVGRLPTPVTGVMEAGFTGQEKLMKFHELLWDAGSSSTRISKSPSVPLTQSALTRPTGGMS